ncbi:hypothetical protein AMECASPLE_027954 [Ameca splendens]|uniref:Uncharacterized protein n=1 Tax=Ameca splendens TaxID=208324 RepID=A0ABV0Z388_9TELE
MLFIYGYISKNLNIVKKSIIFYHSFQKVKVITYIRAFLSCNFDNYDLQIMKTPKSVSLNIRTHTNRLPLYPGPGHGGSRLSRDAQTSLSPFTSSSSSGGSPRLSQASPVT